MNQISQSAKLNALSIVLDMARQGVELYLSEGNLKFRTHHQKLSTAQRQTLSAHKAPICQLLRTFAPNESVLVPLSPIQELVFVHQKVTPDSCAYNLSGQFELAAEFDPVRLQEAATLLMTSQDILRTRISYVYGEPVQRIYAQCDLPLVQTQLDYPDASDALESLDAISDRAFDLERDLLWRLELVKKQDLQYMVVVLHHLITDLMSFELFCKELISLYHNNEPALNPLSVRHFRSQDLLTPGSEQKHVGSQQFWQKNLAGYPGLYRLPMKRSQSQPSFKGHQYDMPFDSQTSQAIRNFAAGLGLTPFMFMFSAYALVLSNLTQRNDLIVSTPISARNFGDWQTSLGDFVNILPVRFQVDSTTGLVDYLQASKSAILSTLQHGRTPFKEIISLIDAQNSPGQHPFSQNSFVWHQMSSTEALANESLIKGVLSSSRQRGAAQELKLTVKDDGSTLHCQFVYDVECYKQEDISALANMYAKTCQQIMQIGDKETALLSDIRLVNNEEIARFSPVIGDMPNQEIDTIEARIFAAAQAYSDKEAIVCGNQSVTYIELHDLALRWRDVFVSHRLTGQPIGVIMNRRPELVAVLLGVMAAGCYYVPIDPNYPEARIRKIMEESQLAYMVTNVESLSEELIASCSVLTLEDASSEAIMKTDVPSADDLAYTIFTSGTTGAPKGVAVEHRSVVNLLDSMQEQIGLAPTESLLAISSYAFDMSIPELYWALSVGGRMVLAQDHEVNDPAALLALIHRFDVSTVHATPTTWQMMLEHPSFERWPRTMLCGAEPLSKALAARLLERSSELWNLYGPTEATVWTTFKKITTDVLKETNTYVSVGSAIKNTGVMVLDEEQRPLPPNIPGELYIYGHGLARGYSNNEQEDIRSFLHINSLQRGRLYRTGDRARFLSSGGVEILGRTDSQVKLNGYRIEIGEIENALHDIPGLETAVVVTQQYQDQTQLCAFHVGEREVDPHLVCSMLSATLPRYAVPAKVIRMATFPLNANGKIDRKILETTVMDEAAPRTKDFRAPETDRQRVLSEIWCEVFRLNEISIDASFTDIGANSLQIVKLAAAIERTIGYRIAVRDLFEHPTIAQLSVFEMAGEPDDLVLTLSKLDQMVPELPPLPEKIQWSETNSIRSVLLTGANGFLGSHILQSLLRDTAAKIICLMRGEDQKHATARLVKALSDNKISVDLDRVEVVCGDISKPKWGLDPTEWLALANSCDVILHNAANVNFLEPLDRLMDVNVGATLEAIALATTGRIKPLHFVSTYSVLNPTVAYVEEAKQPPPHEFLNFGYVQSKWIAEKLLEKAAEHNVPVAIHRPSRVIPSSLTATANKSDLFHRVIHGSINLGSYPTVPIKDNFIPVNYAADIIAGAVMHTTAFPRYFHVVNTEWQKWTDIVAKPLKKLGLKPVSFDTWLEAIKVQSDINPDFELATLEHFLSVFGRLIIDKLGDKHPELATANVTPFSDLYAGKGFSIGCDYMKLVLNNA